MTKSRLVGINVNQIDILKGLGVIGVVVEKVNTEVERLGLTQQALQTDVELLLRKYGIEVAKNPADNYLYINVNVSPSDSGLVAFNISVEFCDIVIPIRNPSITIHNAIVWDTGGTGSVGKKKIGSIREDVEDYVKVFINDYLAANPKR